VSDSEINSSSIYVVVKYVPTELKNTKIFKIQYSGRRK